MGFYSAFLVADKVHDASWSIYFARLIFRKAKNPSNIVNNLAVIIINKFVHLVLRTSVIVADPVLAIIWI